MSNFSGVNLSQSPVQNQKYNAFAGNSTPAQRALHAKKNENKNIFAGALVPDQKSTTEIWHLDTLESEPATVWGDARLEYLATLNPTKKADRSVALGLRTEFLRSLSPEQKEQRKAFLDIRNTNAAHSITKNAGPCPHFLAEA